MIDKYVLGMVVLRLASGSLEVLAAFTMLRLNDIERALLVNSALALAGPIILISTTTIGLVGIADRLSWSKMAWIAAGIACLFIGVLKK